MKYLRIYKMKQYLKINIKNVIINVIHVAGQII